MVTHALAEKLAAMGVAAACRLDVGLAGIHSQIGAFGKERQHVSGTTTDVQNAVARPGTDIFVHHHAAAIIGADQVMVKLVEKWTVENRSNAFNHEWLAGRPARAWLPY